MIPPWDAEFSIPNASPTAGESVGHPAAFPDCKAMRRIDENHWQEVWIELEFESRNFLSHMHCVEGCDLIVCWEHNWPECPLEVLELKAVLGRRAGGG